MNSDEIQKIKPFAFRSMIVCADGVGRSETSTQTEIFWTRQRSLQLQIPEFPDLTWLNTHAELFHHVARPEGTHGTLNTVRASCHWLFCLFCDGFLEIASFGRQVAIENRGTAYLHRTLGMLPAHCPLQTVAAGEEVGKIGLKNRFLQ